MSWRTRAQTSHTSAEASETQPRRNRYVLPLTRRCLATLTPRLAQCVSTLLSMFWWMDNVVYWTNYGCQVILDPSAAKPEWVRPCPADAMCSWMKQLGSTDGNTESFCRPDETKYIKPE
jgi:hypothetical protein